MIDTAHPTLSIRHQCELVGLNRSTFHWEPADESPLNLQLMRLIDKEYTRALFYRYRKMTARLNDHHCYYQWQRNEQENGANSGEDCGPNKSEAYNSRE